MDLIEFLKSRLSAEDLALRQLSSDRSRLDAELGERIQ